MSFARLENARFVSRFETRDTNFFFFLFPFFFFVSDSESDKSVMRLSERQLSTRVQLDDEKSPGRNTGVGSDERAGGWEEGGTRGAHFHRNSARMATPSNATIPQRNLECSYVYIYERADASSVLRRICNIRPNSIEWRPTFTLACFERRRVLRSCLR